MSGGRIEAAVEKIRSEGRVGLMTHIVLGYPSLDESLKLVETMAECGVDFIEIQIPFSDPTADGPVITQACQAALDGGHDVLVLISEVWGGFSPEAMRFLGELSQARNDGIDIERASATWSTSSFTSYHGQLLSLAVQWGVAIEIERAVKKSARFC